MTQYSLGKEIFSAPNVLFDLDVHGGAAGWFLTDHSHQRGYKLSVDASGDGVRTMVLSRNAKKAVSTVRQGGCVHSFEATSFRGDYISVRLSARVVNSHRDTGHLSDRMTQARLWTRVDSPGNKLRPSFYDGGEERVITAEWQELAAVIEVDSHALFVSLGFLLYGTGSLEVRDVSITRLGRSAFLNEAAVPLHGIQVENVAFVTRLLGMVRYFSPADERENVDWGRLACAAIHDSMDLVTPAAVAQATLSAVGGVAPAFMVATDERGAHRAALDQLALDIYNTDVVGDSITASIVAMQHHGNPHQPDSSVFYSRRGESVNGTIHSHGVRCGVLSQEFRSDMYRGQEITWRLFASTSGDDSWTEVVIYSSDEQGHTTTITESAIKITAAASPEQFLDGVVPVDSTSIIMSIRLCGAGSVRIYSSSIHTRTPPMGPPTEPVNMLNPRMIEGELGKPPVGWHLHVSHVGLRYDATIAAITEPVQITGVLLRAVDNKAQQHVIEDSGMCFVDHDIGRGVGIILPYLLYTNAGGETLPMARRLTHVPGAEMEDLYASSSDDDDTATDRSSAMNSGGATPEPAGGSGAGVVGLSETMAAAEADLKMEARRHVYLPSPDNRNARLAIVGLVWNIFYYFAPTVQRGAWLQLLEEILNDAAECSNGTELLHTLESLVSRTLDGQASIKHCATEHQNYMFPFHLACIDKTVVVTAVDTELCAALEIAIGDIIVAVDGRPIMEVIEELELGIAGATPQHVRHRAMQRLCTGQQDDIMRLTVLHRQFNQESLDHKIKKCLRVSSGLVITPPPPVFQTYGDGTAVYIDLSRLTASEWSNNFHVWVQASSIIFDLRLPPALPVATVLRHLTPKTMRSPVWAVPTPRHPHDQACEYTQWTVDPHPETLVGRKLLWLCGASSVGLAETWLHMVRDAGLGVIIGARTAGTCGDVTTCSVLGGYTLSFTGLLAQSPDGARIGAEGVKPHILAPPTLVHAMAGTDTCLEAAMKFLGLTR